MRKAVLLFPFAVLFASGMACAESGETLSRKHKCNVCHKIDIHSIGPSYQEITERYEYDDGASEQMIERIKNGSRGVWGAASMTPNMGAANEEIKTIIDYIMSHKKPLGAD